MARPMSPDDIGPIKERWMNGQSVRRISLDLGVSYESVRIWVRKLELPLDGTDANAARRRLSEHSKKRRAEMAARLLDVAEIALERITDPSSIVVHGVVSGGGGAGSTIEFAEKALVEVTAKELRTLTATIEAAMKTSMTIDNYDRNTADNLSAVDAWLDEVTTVQERGEQYGINEGGEAE